MSNSGNTGGTGNSGPFYPTNNGVYVSSKLTLIGDVTPNNAGTWPDSDIFTDTYFLQYVISGLLTKNYVLKTPTPPANPILSNFVISSNGNLYVGDISQNYIYTNLTFSNFHTPLLSLRNPDSDSSSDIVNLRQSISQPLGNPFEIQVKGGASGDVNIPIIDYIIYYLSKGGYESSADRTLINNALCDAYNYAVLKGTSSSAYAIPSYMSAILINFDSPSQISAVSNCIDSVPGSDKRTAMAVLHDKVNCIIDRIKTVIPQYVAWTYDLGTNTDQLINLAPPWGAWFSNPTNDPYMTPANDASDLATFSQWITDGRMLIFCSPHELGTLSIHLPYFPPVFPPVNGTYIRLCNGNNPYPDYPAVPTDYDNRFIFYDANYNILANLSPGESVRVTWCESLPTPGWISLVGS